MDKCIDIKKLYHQAVDILQEINSDFIESINKINDQEKTIGVSQIEIFFELGPFHFENKPKVKIYLELIDKLKELQNDGLHIDQLALDTLNFVYKQIKEREQKIKDDLIKEGAKDLAHFLKKMGIVLKQPKN